MVIKFDNKVNKRPMGHIAHLRKLEIGEENFWISSMNFRYFAIISPLGRAWPFIWTNLNPLYPGILCVKFSWNWPSGSGEEDENVKSLQTDGQSDGRTDRQTTDDRWSEKLTWAFSTGELKKVNFGQNYNQILRNDMIHCVTCSKTSVCP